MNIVITNTYNFDIPQTFSVLFITLTDSVVKHYSIADWLLVCPVSSSLLNHDFALIEARFFLNAVLLFCWHFTQYKHEMKCKNVFKYLSIVISPSPSEKLQSSLLFIEG